MAPNGVPLATDLLISLAMEARDGAAKHGVSIGLTEHTAEDIAADLAAVIGIRGAKPPVPGCISAHKTAKTQKSTASTAVRSKEKAARAFCATVTSYLKVVLSETWDWKWQAAGFSGGSLVVPKDPLPLLSELRCYFATYPSHESATHGITSATCDFHARAIFEARAKFIQMSMALDSAKAAYDAALLQLHNRMNGVRAELEKRLNDDDARWRDFGFDRPADGWMPGTVSHMVLTESGPDLLFMSWAEVCDAERFRVIEAKAPDMDQGPKNRRRIAGQ